MSEPRTIPINALFGMDFVSQLVVIASSDTMGEVSQKVAAHVVGKRIAPRDLPMAVYHQDQRLPSEWTAEQAGITPMSFVYVDYVDE
ncbi:MAG TPA: toluene-4-monooxygenase system B family protein [Polyangiaceae bacterium]|nr:toluene-4-monooxygenase system B family protein [Polyangiaceae bacterium]